MLYLKSTTYFQAKIHVKVLFCRNQTLTDNNKLEKVEIGVTVLVRV